MGRCHDVMNAQNANQAARGEAVVNIIRWLEDSSFLDADELLSALDLLDLEEGDIEFICRNFTHGRCASVPLVGRVS